MGIKKIVKSVGDILMAKKTKKKKVTKKTAKKKVAKKTAKKKVAKKTAKKKVAKKVVKSAPKKEAAKPTKKAADKPTPKKTKSNSKTKETSKAAKEAKDLSDKIYDEIGNLSEDYKIAEIRQALSSIDFFNIDNDECNEKGCDNPSTTMGYCRYHYIKNWVEIKTKRQILEEGKLLDFIEELVAKFPVKYIEAILQDLQDDKSFFQALRDLNIESDLADVEDGSDDDDFESNEIRDYKSDRVFEDEEV